MSSVTQPDAFQRVVQANPDPVERARQWWLRCCQSFNGGAGDVVADLDVERGLANTSAAEPAYASTYTRCGGSMPASWRARRTLAP